MEIKVTTRELEDSTFVVEVEGSVDVYTSPRLKQVVNEALDQGRYQLLVSLEGVRDIDSTGLGVLIGALKRVRENGGKLTIKASPAVRKIFSLTGLIKIFQVED